MVSEWVDKTTEQLRAEGAVTTGGKTPAKKLSAADGCPDIHAPVEPVPDNDWVGIKMMIMIVSVFSSSHLSPGVSLISDLVHDSGMLQSELFTSRSQNLVLTKLPNSGFWRYGQFFK